jgi:ribonucleoside-diphosphate reductase alpha chain
MSQSLMDYVFRRLALDYMDFETRSFMGIHTAEERSRQLETGSYAPGESASDEEDYEDELESYSQSPAPASRRQERTEEPAIHSSTELFEQLQGKSADAPICMTCGTKMRPAGSCYVCEGCGSTSGCS